ncbi:MAG: nucleotidyltransferase family protein [Arenicellales bacterium]
MPEHEPARDTVSAVVLAAGESRRMGDRNKLTLPLGGESVLRRTVRSVLASEVREVIVVLGHQADALRPLIEDLDVGIVLNEHYREGQMTSVHAGLAALTGACDGVMICLGDQPLMTAVDFDALIRAFQARTDGSILVPVHQGRRGNPVIIATAHQREILKGDRNLGCRKLIEKNPHLVIAVDIGTDHVVVDLDTPDGYSAVRQRVEQESALPV